jgi:hypothetical protein
MNYSRSFTPDGYESVAGRSPNPTVEDGDFRDNVKKHESLPNRADSRHICLQSDLTYWRLNRLTPCLLSRRRRQKLLAHFI